jgi:hypothetical protein
MNRDGKWDDNRALVAFIRDNFVPVVVDNYLPGSPAEKKFYEKTGRVSNGFLVAAASGKALGIVSAGVYNLRKLLEAYRRLPEADRKPIVENTAEKGKPNEMPPSPPPGGLTLIVYNTPLERNQEGKLIRARNVPAPGPSWALQTPITLNDLHWLTRAEWQSMVPAKPKKGLSGSVPEAVQQRLFRLSGYDWSSGYQNDFPPLRSGALTWTVEEVAENAVHLRFEGFSKVGGSPEEVHKCSCKNPRLCNHWGCDLHYLGFMKIDRAKQTIVDLRMVALGETTTRYNRKILANDLEVRAVPTGLVIELAPDCPANRHGWPPMAPQLYRTWINYWNPGPGK